MEKIITVIFRPISEKFVPVEIIRSDADKLEDPHNHLSVEAFRVAAEKAKQDGEVSQTKSSS